MQPSEIKMEMALVGSKGNPLNSYIIEKALSCLSLSNTHKNKHHLSMDSHAYVYNNNNTHT